MPEEDSNAPAAAEPPVKLSRLQKANFVLLLFLTAAFGLWLWAYTYWLPHVSEFLSGKNALVFFSGLAALVWGGVSKMGRKALLFLLARSAFTAALIIALV